MDEKTLEALKGSIRKWEKIVDGTGIDDGNDNCPLCHLFLNDWCEKCPVFQKNNQEFCSHTPYSQWNRHHDDRHQKWEENEDGYRIIGKCRTCKKLAREELEFLQSLLPKDTK